MKPSDWKSEYLKKKPKYEQFTRELKDLLLKLLDREKINSSIEFRTKDEDSFASKITRPGKNYSNPLEEITDLSGLRIIVNTLSDVEKVSEILKREFLIDEEKSIDKAVELDPDRFGYLSKHFIIKLPEPRKALPEWADFKELCAEIQIRTTLQHAWSVVQHPLDYKSHIDIPKSLKRRLYRLSALFELADQELNFLISEAEVLRKTYSEQVRFSKTDIELNLESLRAFVEGSPVVKKWASFIETLPYLNIDTPYYSERDVIMPQICGIKTIAAYEKLLVHSHGWGEEFFKEKLGYPGIIVGTRSFSKNGILLYLLIGNYPNILTEEKLREKFGFGDAAEFIKLAKKINPSFKSPGSTKFPPSFF